MAPDTLPGGSEPSVPQAPLSLGWCVPAPGQSMSLVTAWEPSRPGWAGEEAGWGGGGGSWAGTAGTWVVGGAPPSSWSQTPR